MKDNPLYDKSENFAVRAINLYKILYFYRGERVCSKQIIRSATSIGANVSEAQCAQSDADFLAKLYIAFKECKETMYWLRLLVRTNYISLTEYNSLFKDINEIYSLLTSIIKTIKQKTEDKKRNKDSDAQNS